MKRNILGLTLNQNILDPSPKEDLENKRKARNGVMSSFN